MKLVGFLIFMSIGAVIFLCMRSYSYSKSSVNIGSLAPDFSLFDETHTVQTLSHMRGSRIVLYFYPKDDSPWCTKQSCNLSDGFKVLRDHNINIWGINSGSIDSHASFKTKYNLRFPSLSDVSNKVARLYGVNGLFFTKRITFLIDERGVIVDIIKNVDINNHAQQILDSFFPNK